MKTTRSSWPLLLVMLSLGAPVAHAQFLYTTNADGVTATITGYTGTNGAVSIPAVTNGLAVNAIADFAFANLASVRSLSIPASVTNIGTKALAGCRSLATITVDGNNSYYCSDTNGALFDKSRTTLVHCPSFLSTYTVPAGVVNIGDGAFVGCGFLTMVKIPGAVTNIGNGAFDGCGWLTSVTISNGVTRIGDYAFSETDLGSVTIPNSVTSIGDWAFQGIYGLTSVNIPASVTNMGSAPFSYCNYLTAITVDAANPYFSSVNGVLFNKSRTTLIENPNRSSVGGMIPAGVTSIADYAFCFCNLNFVLMPSSVASIGTRAFYRCYDLQNGVTIPGSVTNIGYEAFSYCGVSTITVAATNANYSSSNGVLFDKNQTTLLQYPGLMAGGYAIPGGVANIADGAFLECAGLSSVSIPTSVTNIGTNVFYGCSALTAITVDAQNPYFSSLNGVLFNKSQTMLIHYPGGTPGGYVIPDGVTGIADDAFDGGVYSDCTNLSSVTIPASVNSIGALTFLSLVGLTNVVIANGVTSIGQEAFLGCGGLSSITIPGTVTSIGLDAFYGCDGLRSIIFTGNPPLAEATVFAYGSATAYYLPGSTGWSSTFAGLTALLWNPVIQAGDGSFGVVNGQFGFNVTGTANIPFVVEACTDLACAAWAPLQTVTLTNGSVYFSDPAQAGAASRFYRIRSP